MSEDSFERVIGRRHVRHIDRDAVPGRAAVGGSRQLAAVTAQPCSASVKSDTGENGGRGRAGDQVSPPSDVRRSDEVTSARSVGLTPQHPPVIPSMNVGATRNSSL